jgi:Fe-S cluster assembly iron-binding protein IscA
MRNKSMTRAYEIAIASVFSASLAGCAGFSARAVATADEDGVANGIRYYEMAPYLLVYADGKGGITSSIEMMPDTSRKMVMDLHSFASANNTTLTFVNGVLTSSKFVVDNTAVPAAIIETIKTLGVAAVSNAMNDPGANVTRRIPAPYLFKIVVDRDGTRLVGGPGVDSNGEPVVIQVTVSAEAVSADAAGTKP